MLSFYLCYNIFYLFIYSIEEDIYILAHLRISEDGGAGGRTTNSRGSLNVRISNPEEKKPIEVDR